MPTPPNLSLVGGGAASGEMNVMPHDQEWGAMEIIERHNQGMQI
ncbi:hypothetical protein [Thermocoleostomius sinensis]|uniref:Uncharacterized protein n=1 Tax=Thermocoleostomius sinensis A174 TaxID=2016057 RepID=A0A9E9CBI5_9CYAN|nr:hypothetical protein [Thermocoleostomius sinensis]WAL62417.1 hypothetical protein OXH18_10630 [Thermocoleostomius sinensis A174]